MHSGPLLEQLCAARRVLIVGPSGAGKTHLALQLSRVLDLPVIHLDSLRWRPGWTALADAEWRALVTELTQQSAWIMDGTYESTLDLRIPASDAIIILEVVRVQCILGLLIRHFLGKRPRPDAPSGERIDRAFLRYVWRYPVVTRPFLLSQLRRHGEGKTVIVAHGRRQARRLVQSVQHMKSATHAQASPRHLSRADKQ